jgi:putative transposase
MAKIVPSERLRRELDEVLAGVGEHDDPVEAVARIGARLILQQALEDEVTEFLGRERYARADGDAAIYRTGYEPRTVKTTSGSIEPEAHEVGEERGQVGHGGPGR